MSDIAQTRQAYKDLGRQKLADFKAKRSALSKPVVPTPKVQYERELHVETYPEAVSNHTSSLHQLVPGGLRDSFTTENLTSIRARSSHDAVLPEALTALKISSALNNGDSTAHQVHSTQRTSLNGDTASLQSIVGENFSTRPDLSSPDHVAYDRCVSPPLQEPSHPQNPNDTEDQLKRLQSDLDALTSHHSEAISTQNALSMQLQNLQVVEKHLLLELQQTKAEAETNLKSQLSILKQEAEAQLRQALESSEQQNAIALKQAMDSEERKSALALQQAEERLNALAVRVSELEVELESMTQLKSETEIELCKWREMVGDLSAMLESKVSELEIEISQAKAQALGWEEKHAQLLDRHSAARAEFEKLKQLSSERKQTISELQQQLEEARQQLTSNAENLKQGQDLQSIQEMVAAEIKEAEEKAASQIKEAQDFALSLRAELEEARQRIEGLEDEKVTVASAAAASQSLLMQKLEEDQKLSARVQEELQECLLRLSDVTEQRDALKEAVQDMQEETEQSYLTSQKQLLDIQDFKKQVQIIPELEAEVARLQSALESSLKENLMSHTQALEELNRQVAEALLQASSSASALEELKVQHAKEVAGMAETIHELRVQLEGVQSSDQKLTDMQAKLVRAKTQFDKLRVTCAENKEKAAKYKAEAAELKEANEQLQQQLQGKSLDQDSQIDINSLQQELMEARAAYSLISGQLESLIQENAVLTQQTRNREEHWQREAEQWALDLKNAESAAEDLRAAEAALLMEVQSWKEKLLEAESGFQATLYNQKVTLEGEKVAEVKVARVEVDRLKTLMHEIQEEKEEELQALRREAEEQLQALLQPLEITRNEAVHIAQSLEQALEVQSSKAKELQIKTLSLETEVSSLNVAKQEADKKVKEAEDRAIEAEARVAGMKEKLGLAKQKFLKMQATAQERKEELSALQSQLELRDQTHAQQCSQLVGEVEALKDQLSVLQSAHTPAQQQQQQQEAARLEDQVASLEICITELRESLEAAQRIELVLREQAAEQSDHVILLQQQLENAQQEVSLCAGLKEELAEVQAEHAEVVLKLRDLNHQHESVSCQYKELLERQEEQEMLQQVLSEARGRVQELEKDLAEATEELHRSTQASPLTPAVNIFSSHFEETEGLKARIRELEEQLLAKSGHESRVDREREEVGASSAFQDCVQVSAVGGAEGSVVNTNAPAKLGGPDVSSIPWGGEEDADGWEAQEMMLPLPAQGQQYGTEQAFVQPPADDGPTGSDAEALIEGAPLDADAEAAVRLLREQLEEAQYQVEELSRQVEDLEDARAAGALVAKEANQRAEHLARQVEELKQQILDLEEHKVKVAERAANLNATLEEASLAAIQTEEALAESERRTTAAEAEMQQLKVAMQEMEIRMSQLHASVVEVNGVEEGRQSSASIAVELQEWQARCSAAESRIVTLEERLVLKDPDHGQEQQTDLAQKEVLQLKAALTQSEYRISEGDSALNQAHARIHQLQLEVAESEVRLGNLQEHLASVMAGRSEGQEAAELAGRSEGQEAAELAGRIEGQEAAELAGRSEGQEAAELAGRSEGQEAAELAAQQVEGQEAAELAAQQVEGLKAQLREVLESERMCSSGYQVELEKLGAVLKEEQESLIRGRGLVTDANSLTQEQGMKIKNLEEDVQRLQELVSSLQGEGRGGSVDNVSPCPVEDSSGRSESLIVELETLRVRMEEAQHEVLAVTAAREAERDLLTQQEQVLRLQIEEAVGQLGHQQEINQQLKERIEALEALMQQESALKDQLLRDVRSESDAALHQLQEYSHGLQHQLQHTQDLNLELQQSVAQLQAEVAEAQHGAQLKLEAHEAIAAQQLLDLQSRSHTLMENLAEARALLRDAEERAAFEIARVAALESSLQEAESKDQDLNRTLAQKEEDLRCAEERVADSATAIVEALQAREQLEETVSSLQHEILILRQQQGVLQQRIMQAESREHSSQHYQSALEQQAAQLEEMRRQLDTAAAAPLQEQCVHLQQQVHRFENEQQQLLLQNQQLLAQMQLLGSSGDDSHNKEVQDLRRQVLELQSEKAVLSSRAANAAVSPSEVDAFRMQVTQLEAALKGEQRRAAEYYAQLVDAMAARNMPAPPRSVNPASVVASPMGSPGMMGAYPGAGKKQDDGLPGASSGFRVYDPESAVLQGASTTFQPLAGWMRGRGRALGVMASAAGLLDMMTVALYRRPGARVVLFVYFVLLHAAVMYL
ncbi:hypothetical protein CEUSTIGMA_g367.t1 [Chlamydomonas eustigma]|uniref:Uncharacterized protein n=1 Tax=Chlamydomonas eustigma TaxID=1157962 RepID=A0A250WQH2_9CHLO|nr:hypothetical protein CEUSTIGMA_g367.t1 [Chlamydomonas eustigma]|eukprot:GAX72912.1 hypothetical protein CEUSTIGMA_g367.t1 [Chlamydomonas eustigma]